MAIKTVRVVMEMVTTLAAGPATQINCIAAPRKRHDSQTLN
jgi:hypothetical protein